MSKITINQIKKLRTQTGAGIMEIKKALEEAGGDEKRALKILKKMGTIKAGKKEKRKTGEGVVEAYIHVNGKVGSLVVLACETDFVARTAEFKNLAHEIAMQVCAMNPRDNKELLAQLWIRDESKTISDLIKEHIAKFGENIKLEDFKRLEVGHGS